MSEGRRLAKFEAYGIELEYMIVAADGLQVQPVADKLLAAMAEDGEMTSYVCGDLVAWSNELVLHVIEAKTNGPQRDLKSFMGQLQDEISKVSRLAKSLGCQLLPTAMHPFFDPEKDGVRLWPHEDAKIYNTYNRIFNCSGHGWANLQSMHINLPFADDDDFARVHTAVRLVLPLIAPLAASSPIVDGRFTGYQDNRLRYYKNNQKSIPSIIGHLVPEMVCSRAEYEKVILAPIYRDIAPHDPEGVVRNEWLNSRGAIARFSRGAIEIRVIDSQECTRADLALASLIISLVQALDQELFAPFSLQKKFEAPRLHAILQAGVVGQRAKVEDAEYLSMFGCSNAAISYGDLWQEIYGRLAGHDELALAPWRTEIEHLLTHGNLASRIQKAMGPAPTPQSIQTVYHRLADCLLENRFF